MSKSTKGIEFVKIPVMEYHYLVVNEFKSRQVADWLKAQKSVFADITPLRVIYGDVLPDVNDNRPEGE